MEQLHRAWSTWVICFRCRYIHSEKKRAEAIQEKRGHGTSVELEGRGDIEENRGAGFTVPTYESSWDRPWFSKSLLAESRELSWMRMSRQPNNGMWKLCLAAYKKTWIMKGFYSRVVWKNFLQWKCSSSAESMGDLCSIWNMCNATEELNF